MSILKDGLIILRLVKELGFEEYHADMPGSLFVWVNLSREVLQTYTKIQSRIKIWEMEGTAILEELKSQIKEAVEAEKKEKELKKIREANGKKFEAHVDSIDQVMEELFVWYSVIWSQHKDELHHWSVSEIRLLYESSKEDDSSSFWNWLTNKTQSMILMHRNQHLKKLKRIS